MAEPTTHRAATIAVLVENEAGILARVVGLFSGRGYNIESLTVAPVDEERRLSRITIVTSGTDMVIEQIKAQLDRLVPVHKVLDLTEAGPHVERELALVKVTSKTAQLRSEIMQVVDIYRARVVDVAMGSLTVEVTGPTDKIDSIVGLLKPYGIKEMVRTGTVAMARGIMAGQEKGREALATRDGGRLREVS